MQIFKLALRGFSLLVCVLMFASQAYSQNTTGSIVGTVTDSNGAAVANATVTVTNNATADKRIATTSDSGEYQVLTLLPGQYSVTIEGAGFKRYVRDAVDVQVEQTTRINAQMVVGAVTEEITVTSPHRSCRPRTPRSARQLKAAP